MGAWLIVSPEAFARRTLLGLPATEWARRMRRGGLRLTGRVEACTLSVGGWPLEVDAGAVTVRAEFRGGPAPVLERVEVHGSLGVDAAGGCVPGHRLVLYEQKIFVDGVEVPRLGDRVGAGRLFGALVGVMSDVDGEAWAEPDGEVVLDVGGIEARVPRGVLLTVNGAARGPSDGLVLCRPVEIGFGGDGLRLQHERLEWLSRLAGLRIARATVHPDGSVALEGRGAPGFDVAVRGSLRTASAGLSAFLRRSPGVRRFLRPGRLP